MCCLALCVCFECWYSVFNLVFFCVVVLLFVCVWWTVMFFVYCVLVLLYGVVCVLRVVCIVRL